MKKEYFILFLLIFYLFFQLSTLDYGSKINDLKYFKNITLNQNDIKSFIEAKKIKKKNLDNLNPSWQHRYKLYSINADEMIPIMALSKIKINENKFDPQIYKYGGAFLYPLGLYYYSLIKLNLIENIEIDSITKNENLIDKIYTQGRFFVLLCFTLSAFFLYKSLNLITTKNFSLIFTMIYLFSPSSIMYSQIIKPNWYALLWVNLSIFFGLKYLLKEKKRYFLLLVSIFLGLAIGSSVLFIPVLFFILFFIYFKTEKEISKKNIIILVATSFIVFFVTNPYILINFSNFAVEANDEYMWVLGNINYKKIIFFFNNSFVPGFGIIFSLCFFYYLLVSMKKSSERNLGLGLILLLLFGSILGSFDDWHIQFRYIPYILPISLIFISYKIKNKKLLCILLLISTIVQMVPLKKAYYDENNSKFSTRLNSAKWINKNIIEKKKSICKKDFSPFDFPPVNFNKIIIKKKCDYEIYVLRQPKKISNYNKKKIVKIFEPRYQFKNIPLIFSHVNPLIIIVKK